MNDVYVLNDPTEGFVVARNDGTGVPADYMNFLVTDTYYYNVDGKEVAFKASEKTPATPDLFFTQSQSYWLGRCESH